VTDINQFFIYKLKLIGRPASLLLQTFDLRSILIDLGLKYLDLTFERASPLQKLSSLVGNRPLGVWFVGAIKQLLGKCYLVLAIPFSDQTRFLGDR
jgi:hypothetical protein